MKQNHLYTAIMSVALTSGAAVSAQAEDSNPRALAIEEVMVTANRRQESAQDVAISVTALSGEAMEKLGFQDMTQITQQVPNFSAQGLFGPSGPPFLNIRGISFIDYSDANESSVGIYVDDVYYGAQGAASGQLFDVERVEVLRGPQGTLFGRNTTGGLVHYVSKKPGDELEAKASVQLGSYEQEIIEAAAGGPLTETLGLRVAFKSNRDDGYQTNEVTDTQWAQTQVLTGRATAVYQPTDNLDATLSYHYSDSDSTMVGYGMYGNRDPENVANRCSIAAVQSSLCTNRTGFRDPDPDPVHIYSEADSYPNDYSARGGYLTVNWGLADTLQLTSVSGYEEYERFSIQDIDASDNSIDQLGVYAAEISQFSQELRLSGSGDRLNWVSGVYFYSDDRSRSSDYVINGTPLQSGSANLTTESAAVFAQADWQLAERWSLVAGLRYTDETRELNDLDNRSAAGTSLMFDENGPLDSYSDDLSGTHMTYKAALEWRPVEDVLTYLQYSTGFKSGGFNPSLVTDIKQVGPVGEETLKAWELGLKSTLLDGRLRVNGAFFYYDFTDYQALAGTSINDVPVTLFLNAGDATVLGSELELTYVPAESWELSLGLGTLDTEFAADPGVTIDGRPLDGKELPSAPAWNANATINYYHALAQLGELNFQASMVYQDDVFFGPDNNPSEIQEGYGLVNLRAVWTSADSQYRVEAFVDNVLDKAYHMQKFESSGAFFDAAYGVWGRPRMGGVKFSYQY